MALFITLIAVPIIRHRAIAVGKFDAPGERKIHKTPIPRLGGVGIWLGFMLSFLILVLFYWQYPHGNGVSGILAGGGLMFLLGLLDDLYNLSPSVKLMGQILAALVAFALGVQVNTLDLPGAKLLVLNALSLPVTLLWLVGITNALNFIDGVDGLAGGVTTISAVTLAVVAVFTHQPVAALLAAILAGACLGFLVFNFYPARIFMGDSGALFCGFTLAAIAVTGVLKTQVVVMLLPILVLSVPILDIFYSTFRRLLKGKSPFVADSEHIHHRLLSAGFSQIHTVIALYAVCVIAGMIATGYLKDLDTYIRLLIGLFALAAGLIVLIRKLFPLNRGNERGNILVGTMASPSLETDSKDRIQAGASHIDNP